MASTAISPPSVQAMQFQNGMQQQPATVLGGGFLNLSLYVGDLDPTVDEGQLFDLFNQVGQVVSVRVCRDQTKKGSLGYGYVNYTNAHDAANALELLNFLHINGKPIRVMFSNRDPSIRKSGFANIFIKNLDMSIDNKALHETFSTFGTILSCKIASDIHGKSRGYGFVQFQNDESARTAIERLDGMLINDKQVYVGYFVRSQERNNGSPKFTNVYVNNFSETTSEDDLKDLFGKYGEITSAVVMKDLNGVSKGFGFVNFQNPDSAAAAVENLNGSTFSDDKVLFVGKAQRKFEREAELRKRFEQERNSRFEKFQGSNLYIKNLADTIDEDKVREVFSEFGTITSCKVMLDQQGVSKGAGFVSFSTPEEAGRALSEINGKMVGGKPLYVAIAQRKEERRARLQAHFASQIHVGAGMTVPAPLSPFHSGGTPSPRGYYGQIPPQSPPVYGFQQQLLPPGIRPPNFMVPYSLQRQPPRTGARRGGNPQHINQQLQQQMMCYNIPNQNFRYGGDFRNPREPPMVPQGFMGPTMPPYDASMMPPPPTLDAYHQFHHHPGPLLPVSTLASALASASPDRQRAMLGEELYPLVERIESRSVRKVTGMLLEMDQTEVLHLIEDPEALRKKVAEAMGVLSMDGTHLASHI